MTAKETILQGKAVLGIEFGSTRIKAILIDEKSNPIAQGSHEWENQLVDGLWTYSIDAMWQGLQECYTDLRRDVKEQYDCEVENLAAIGFSAMMHGYMAFNKTGQILVPFRTWRNTNTAEAAAKLSELFVFNIPLRWSISHLYQCILDNDAPWQVISTCKLQEKKSLALVMPLACSPSTLTVLIMTQRW